MKGPPRSLKGNGLVRQEEDQGRAVTQRPKKVDVLKRKEYSFLSNVSDSFSRMWIKIDHQISPQRGYL